MSSPSSSVALEAPPEHGSVPNSPRTPVYRPWRRLPRRHRWLVRDVDGDGYGVGGAGRVRRRNLQRVSVLLLVVQGVLRLQLAVVPVYAEGVAVVAAERVDQKVIISWDRLLRSPLRGRCPPPCSPQPHAWCCPTGPLTCRRPGRGTSVQCLQRQSICTARSMTRCGHVALVMVGSSMPSPGVVLRKDVVLISGRSL